MQKQQIRLPIILSATVLIASACTNLPMENQSAGTAYSSNSYSNNSYNTTPSPRIPEAGPLTEAPSQPQQTVAYNSTTQTHQSTPAATVPQVNSHTNTTHTNVVATTQNQPDQTIPEATYTAQISNTPNDNPYSTYAAYDSDPSTQTTVTTAMNTTADNQTNGGDDYSSSNYNDSYDSYGTGNVADNTNNYAANTAVTNNNHYTTSNTNTTNTSYDSYTSGGGGTQYAAGSSNNYASASNVSHGTGGAAVQIFATISQDKAERVRQEINSMGMTAVIDQVDGLYKVRVPYPDEGTARANLMKVRHASGESGAFVTMR